MVFMSPLETKRLLKQQVSQRVYSLGRRTSFDIIITSLRLKFIDIILSFLTLFLHLFFHVNFHMQITIAEILSLIRLFCYNAL